MTWLTPSAEDVALAMMAPSQTACAASSESHGAVYGQSIRSANSVGHYNQVINGKDYYLLQEWSDQSSGCAL